MKFLSHSLVRPVPLLLSLNKKPNVSVKALRMLQTTSVCYNKDNSSSSYVHPHLAYSFGLSSTPFMIDTIPDLLNERAEHDGDKIGLVSHSEGIRKSFRDIKDEATHLAASLHQRTGISKGDTIGIWAVNCASWVITKFAGDILGTIQATINPFYKMDELVYAVNQSRMKVLFMPGSSSIQQNFNIFEKMIYDQQFEHMISESQLTDIVFLDGDKKTDKIGKLRVHTLKELMQLDSGLPPPIVQDSDDPSILMYTSGTTGKPKGALVSQFMIINNAHYVSKRNYEFFNKSKGICCPLPLFHSYALVQAIGVVIPGYRFDPRSVCESIIANQCNVLMVTPTMALDLIEHMNRRNIKLESLTAMVLGGALSDPEFIRRLKVTIPSLKIVLNGYGSTELSPCCTISGFEDPEEMIATTVGRAVDHLEIKIVDPKSNKILKHGEKGELWVRGHCVMIGYFENAEKTREVITPARWYRTGDIAVMNSQGFFNIVGRIKDLIIRGGENVYPQEIENILVNHPSISEAHVFGIPESRLGEEICVWIKLKDNVPELTVSEVKTFITNKITYFKVPKHVFFVKEFPLTSTFKASKLIMRDITINKLLKN